MFEGGPDELDAYLDLGPEEIARLVLCLSIEELLQKRLATYRRLGVGEWRSEDDSTLSKSPPISRAAAP